MNILIVEPSKVTRTVIARELQGKGYTIFESETAAYAIELCNKFKMDIITMAVYLPDSDGFQLCSKLRVAKESDPYYSCRNANIAFITSQDTIEGRINGFQAGATEFLLKKDILSELQNFIHHIENPPWGYDTINALIVDDSAINRMMVQHLLLAPNVNIIEVEDGQEAFDYVVKNTGSIDLIISDFYMPEMNGTELCRRLRVIQKLKSLPIIILTAATDKAEILEIFKSGATDYLTKPFIKEEFLARVEIHLKSWFVQKQAMKRSF
ncbi:MAG: response regulator [Leptospiraceae bacterium]|nr:response regulator [Leptospiraceae bacterium]MCP5502215.1 response regulator [Leptospiraceae bacterium]